MAKAKLVKYQVRRSCRVGDDMINQQPDRSKPYRVVELDPDDAKGQVNTGALKEVKARKKK